MNGQNRSDHSTDTFGSTVADIHSVATKGLSQLTRNRKLSSSTIEAYGTLSPSVRNVVDHTVAFRFRTKRGLGTATGDSAVTASMKDAQFYVNLIEQASSQLADNIPNLLALKCRYCAESSTFAESSHVSGCLSLLDMEESETRVEDLKKALHSRLNHIRNGCPHAKAKLSPSEMQTKFGQPYSDKGPGLDAFVKGWTEDLAALYFHKGNGVTPQADVRKNPAQVLQHLQPPKESKPMVTPPQPSEEFEIGTSDGDVADVRTVIDIQYLPPGITNEDDTSLGQTLEETFRGLPDALQILLTKTSICKFYRRPADQPNDKENYSEAAYRYLGAIDKIRSQTAQLDALTSVCLFCTCCRSHPRLVNLNDIHSSSLVFAEIARQHLIHTMRCPASKRLLGGKMEVVMSYNFAIKAKAKMSEFARICLTGLQRKYFTGSSRYTGMQQTQTPLAFATTEASSRYQIEKELKREHEEKLKMLEQQQERRQKEKQQNVQTTKAAPREAALKPKPKQAPLKSPPPTQEKAMSTKAKKSPVKSGELPLEYRDLYVNALDDLEWKLVNPYESDDESIEGESRHIGWQKALDEVTLPSPDYNEEVWVPLQSGALSRCPSGVPYIVEHPSYDESAEKSPKRPRIASTPSATIKRLAFEVLGRPFKPYDVVLPVKGCTMAMVEVMNNLRGNRFFMRLVSENRGKYDILSTLEGKKKLAEDVVEKIQSLYNGGFYKATTRKTDGTPIIKTCRKGGYNNEALGYTIFRLENGFQDVLHSSLFESLFVLPASVPRLVGRTQESIKNDSAKQEHKTKTNEVEHAPMVGLLHGRISWRTQPINSSQPVKLSDFVNAGSHYPISRKGGVQAKLLHPEEVKEASHQIACDAMTAKTAPDPFDGVAADYLVTQKQQHDKTGVGCLENGDKKGVGTEEKKDELYFLDV